MVFYLSRTGILVTGIVIIGVVITGAIVTCVTIVGPVVSGIINTAMTIIGIDVVCSVVSSFVVDPAPSWSMPKLLQVAHWTPLINH